MKHFSPKILLLLLVLPLILAACGGGKTDNAKSFLEAMNDEDADKAKDNACDAVHGAIDELLSRPSLGDVEVGDCEEDGDTNVKCSISIDDEDVDITLIMDDDDKVCGGDLFASTDIEIPDVEIPDVEVPDVEVPDTDADTSE
jgi:hypothetical protein